MGSIYQGTPQTATSYTTSTTETPQWLQDAIYNQIQWSQQQANAPYEPYTGQLVAPLSNLQNQAYTGVQGAQGAWQPAMTAAQTGMATQTTQGTAGALGTAQNAYLNPSDTSAAGQGLAAGQGYYNQAGALSPVTAAAANLANAGQTSVQGIGQYMNPYQQNVLDTIAKQGSRNLTENLLPGVSDAFVKAGQFGSNRMGEFGSRALRDTQEAVLNAQSAAAQQGYTQALGASQADLARQAQIGQTQGQLTQAQQAQLAQLGQAQTAAGQTQQQYGLNAATGLQSAQAADLQRQMSALQQQAALAQQGQQSTYSDLAALENAGAAQQNQQQLQNAAALQQYQTELNYPKTQLDWLNQQVRGMAPFAPSVQSSTGATSGQTYSASPLSQVASGLGTAMGLSKLLG